MDSNNTSLNNDNITRPSTASLDIRDVATFLLSKIWIIALVVLCFAIVAFLWTNFFVDEVYTSSTDMFIISTTGVASNSNTTSNQMSNWSIGKQLTKTSSELIMGDYCDYVAKALNAHNAKSPETKEDDILTSVLNSTATNTSKPLASGISFSDTFSGTFGERGITGSYIRSHISVNSDDETCIVSVTATTGQPKLSAALSNAVMSLFGEYINDFMEGEEGEDTVKTKISASGAIPSGPSNANSTRNAVIFGIIGGILICALLTVIFIFDDKIKTPDDIEKQLKLSVLGAIPEIDEV
jgi:capsular polysaccharide biosynthesis protein